MVRHCSQRENSAHLGVKGLNKAIYGLKQSGRCWNEKFDGFVKSLGFIQSNADKCVFTGIFEGIKIYLALYVDDGLIFGRDKKALIDLIQVFKTEFPITTSPLNYFIGMEISHDKNDIFISQKLYVDKILRKFKMIEANPAKTSADANVRITNPANPRELSVPYREVVGSLLFLAMVSRPDIAYAVGIASRYLDNHDEAHWNAVKHILRYIKGTRNFGLLFRPNHTTGVLLGYSDKDYAADLDTRRSTSGYVFMMNGGCITWLSKQQASVSLGTTEAEFIAASEATKEAIWLRNLLYDIGHECENPTILNMDNQSSIKLTKNQEFHRGSKHIDVRYHFICDKVRENVIDP